MKLLDQWIAWMLMIMIFLTLVGCQSQKETSDAERTETTAETTTQDQIVLQEKEKGRLVLNGKPIEGARVVFMPNRDAMIPVVSVLEAMGIEINWDRETDGVAVFTYRDKEYTLNINRGTLIDAEGFDLILTPPGGTSAFIRLNHDCLVDTESLHFFFEEFGLKLHFHYDEKSVEITTVA